MNSFINFFLISQLFFVICEKEVIKLNIIDLGKEQSESHYSMSNGTNFNLSQEILSIYDQNIVFFISLTDLDLLNDNFHVIEGNLNDSSLKDEYLKSYDNIFKNSNQTPKEFSLQIENFITKNITKIIDEGKIQFEIKFIKDFVVDSNYLDLKNIDKNLFIKKIGKLNLSNFYDYHILISSNKTIEIDSINGYQFYGKSDFTRIIEDLIALNITFEGLNSTKFINEEFTKYCVAKINIKSNITNILKSILNSEFSKVNLRNYLKHSEIQSITEILNEIKKILIFIEDSNHLNPEKLNKLKVRLEEKVMKLKNYLSSYDINAKMSNIFVFYAIYIIILTLFLIYLASKTVKEIVEFYRKKIL